MMFVKLSLYFTWPDSLTQGGCDGIIITAKLSESAEPVTGSGSLTGEPSVPGTGIESLMVIGIC